MTSWMDSVTVLKSQGQGFKKLSVFLLKNGFQVIENFLTLLELGYFVTIVVNFVYK